MAGRATKAANSPFYKARMEAAAFNDNYNSREGAAEELGIDRTRLARIELGSINPYPEEVLMMADTYNSPELTNHYCAKLCPLGKETIQEAELLHLDRLTIKVLGALGNSKNISETLLKIVEDGTITHDEIKEAREVLEALTKIAKTATQMNLWIEKNLK